MDTQKLLKQNKVNTGVDNTPIEYDQKKFISSMASLSESFPNNNKSDIMETSKDFSQLMTKNKSKVEGLRLLTYNFFLRPIVADDDHNDWKKERLQIFCET